MKDEDGPLLAAYGEAMLYSHLIEDMLKLILRDASFFRVNQYEAPPKLPWRAEALLKEFEKAFPGSAEQVRHLDVLRQARNKITHALIPEVGSDLLTDTGREQIQAMLARYTKAAKYYRAFLGRLYGQIVNDSIRHNPLRIFDRDDEGSCGRVTTSEIEALLIQIKI